MTAYRYVTWIAISVITWVIVYLCSRRIFRKEKKKWTYLVIALLEVILAAVIAFIAVAVNTWKIWHFNMALLGFYIALWGNAVANIIFFIISLIAENKGKNIDIKVKFCISAIAAATILLFGTLNMQTIVPNIHTYESEKIKGSHCFVVVADVHGGIAQSSETVEKMFSEIEAIDPEFMVLNGDITDEFTSGSDMEALYEEIGNLNMPIYFVYGNHDRQENAYFANGQQYTPSELENAILSNGIEILKDDVAEIGSDISILGREDDSNMSRLPVNELPARDADRYQITFDHQPYNEEDILSTNADLQVSGHSHAGQYFPLEILYDLVGFDAYGEYRKGNTILCVSSGVGGWSVPFRTARRCNYDVFIINEK